MFLLHTEARGYLPIGSAAYRPHSARQLAEDSRMAQSSFSRRATQRWDRMRTLVRMVRTGDRSAGVPAYNGSLFAASSFPGSDLLEQAEIADVYLAPALAAIAYETDKPDAPGLDYGACKSATSELSTKHCSPCALPVLLKPWPTIPSRTCSDPSGLASTRR